jgi:hypothetical protein
MTLVQQIQPARTEVFRQRVDHPNAWTVPDIGGKANVTVSLTAAQFKAIDELLAKTVHLAPQAVTREQFDHPALNDFLVEIKNEIMNGRGFVVITGITRDRYSEDQFERIYWGFGTHWGHAVLQSPRGDRLGHVRYIPPAPEHATRAYTSANELYPHADANEIVGLMCVQKAKSGGVSSLMSSIAAHNVMLKERPDLLEPLYEGYQFTTREALHRGQQLTPYRVPIFSSIDGNISCYYNRAYIYRAEEFTGKLPEKLVEAMRYLDSILERDDIALSFMLEPGEMAIWHNFTVLHSRTAFEDDDDPSLKRHLLRLWLDVPNGRPMIPVYYRDLVAGT